MSPKKLMGFRLSEASTIQMRALLPKIRKRTGQNCTVSEFVRQSIAFGIKHSDDSLK